MIKQPRLMILGASTAQLPVILQAQKMGCYIITVDNVPNNIGHQFSDQSVNCSTVDQRGVCKVAQQLDIDGVVTFASDIATCTVAFVASTLKLQGCPLPIAETLSNKENFRKFQRQNHLNHPNFFIASDERVLTEQASSLQPPLIFKPIDTSGSRGIVKIDEHNLTGYIEAFTYAQKFSRSGNVSIERFVDGIDASGDGFLVKGQLSALVSQKYQQGFIPIGHSFPTDIPLSDQMRIFDEVSKTCQILGYQDGPIDFDVKLSSSNVTIIEMGPRLGGNGIPELIRHSSNIDLIELTINYALGEHCVLPKKPDHYNHCGSWVFGSEIEGKVEHFISMKEMSEIVPELFGCCFNYEIGEQIQAFEHSGNSLGYALFDISSTRNYKLTIEHLRLIMDLRVIPAS